MWTLLLALPLVGGIQEICARIGIVTGRGLAGNLRRHFPRPWLYGSVALLVVANTLNIGADIGAIAASVQMLAGGPILIYTLAFGLGSALVEVVVPYHRYVALLRWLCLAVFSYVGVAFVVHVPWGDVARAIYLPSFEWSRASLLAVVAIFGTTISPYLFFWQASEEVEEQQISGWERPLRIAPYQAQWQLTHMEADTWVGMTVSAVVAFFVILSRFYIVIAVSTLTGIVLNVLHFDPIRALFWTAVVNGVASAPLMLVIMLLANRRSCMGDFVLPRRLQVLGWAATLVVAASSLALIVTLVSGY